MKKISLILVLMFSISKLIGQKNNFSLGFYWYDAHWMNELWQGQYDSGNNSSLLFGDDNSEKKMSLGIQGIYGLSEKSDFYLKLGIYSNDTYTYTNDRNFIYTPPQSPQGNYTETSLKSKQNNFYTVLGVRFNESINKFRMGFGIGIIYVYIGNYERNIYSNQTDSAYAPILKTEANFKLPGGYSFGLEPSLDFNYNMSDRFSLKLELTDEITYTKIKGTSSQTNTNTFPTYSQTSYTRDFTREKTGALNIGLSFGITFQLTENNTK